MKSACVTHWTVLPGVPAGSGAWRRLKTPLTVHAFKGLETQQTRSSWRLDDFVDEADAAVPHEAGLIGQDLGGVVAAMLCARRLLRGETVPALVLTGTALGRWWVLTRASALPVVQRYFYRHHGGRRFVRDGVGPASRDEILAQVEPILSETPDFPQRMRTLATEMRPPRGLAFALKGVRTTLIWGSDDPWYPRPIARRLARQLDAPLHLVPGRHYPMWESPSAFDARLSEITAVAAGEPQG